METEKLYYQDPYLTAFTARVLSCEKSKSGWAVVLDRTAFYPEGGGQPEDHGTLGAVQVTDVHETKGVIFHTCDGPVEIGTQVAGAVDWPRRFDHMQQHSGEHILSGLLCSLYHCDNVGFHLGADTVTIDYNAELTWEQVMAAEKAANEVIWQDTPVDITFPAPDALARLNYRSKKALTGQVRIVAFPGAVQRPQVLRVGGRGESLLPAVVAAVGKAEAIGVEFHPPDLPAPAVQFRVDEPGLVLFLKILFDQHVGHSIPSLRKKSQMAVRSACTLPWAKPFRPPPRPERAAFSRFTRGEMSAPSAWTRA